MSSGKFFTFPLCLLSMQGEEKKRLEIIVSHSIKRAGSESDIEFDDYLTTHTVPDFNRNSDAHCAVIRGAIICGVQINNVQPVLKECQEAQEVINMQEIRYGKDALVFVAAELLWDCKEGNIRYRDFSALCGINSVIGFKNIPVLIRRVMIAARQLGYKSPAIMRAEIKRRKDQKELTPQQIRDTLDRLEERELITRCQASMTKVYFSTSLKWEELRTKVAEIKNNRQKLELRRNIERQTFENQTTTNGEPQENHLKRKSAKSNKKEPLKKEEPSENQVGTTPATTEGTTKRTTTGTTEINASYEMPLKQVPYKEEPLKSVSSHISESEIEAAFAGKPAVMPQTAQEAFDEYNREFNPKKLRKANP